ncbi:MAG TPA: DNA polymerase IV [Methanoregulaceae archaeon]|nr:DNA polymerase IV [Methanoregulaceae archaeon]
MEQETQRPNPKPRIIAHIDMDAFFAAVETREHPEFAGKPVIVGADPKEGKGRGVVSTASYEARVFGIHSAMPISKAYERCPHGIFTRPHFDLYCRISSEIMAIVVNYGDRFEQVSIDEAYIDMSSVGSFTGARDLANQMKSEIRKQTGLSCSVGIGPSKIVAKIASDFRKPDGLTVVNPGQVPDFLSPLPVEKIPGVGKKTRVLLHKIGILSIGDLACVDVQELTGLFGKWGAVLHDLATGTDDREVRQEEGYKSISRETTFDEDTNDIPGLERVLDTMATELHAHVLDEGLRFKTITLKVRDEHFRTYTRSKTLERFTNDIGMIKETANSLLSGTIGGQKLRLIGLRLSGFEAIGTRQTTIEEFRS